MTVNVRVRGRLDTTVEANDGQEKYGPLRLGDNYMLGLNARRSCGCQIVEALTRGSTGEQPLKDALRADISLRLIESKRGLSVATVRPRQRCCANLATVIADWAWPFLLELSNWPL